MITLLLGFRLESVVTIAELILVLMRYDGSLPVYAANWHEEYGEVTELNIRDWNGFDDQGCNFPNRAITIVGSL